MNSDDAGPAPTDGAAGNAAAVVIREARAAGNAAAVVAATDHSASTPRWRRLPDTEDFIYQYEPTAGELRGYIIDSDILVGQEIRPRRVRWFLQHCDALHGTYPADCTDAGILRIALLDEMPWASLGFLMKLGSGISYGKCRHSWWQQQ